MKLKHIICFSFFLFYCYGNLAHGSHIIWKIGKDDNAASEFALAPSGYEKFLEKDFGYEDRYFLINYSNERKDFPYVLPGPQDAWGGTGGTSGWRTHEVNILFSLQEIPVNKNCKIVVDLVDLNTVPTVVKLKINDKEKRFSLKGTSADVIFGNTKNAKEKLLELNICSEDLKKGGNCLTISVLEGSWIVFDQVYLEASTPIKLNTDFKQIFLRQVTAANYEIQQNGAKYQPLLVDVEHLSGVPKLCVNIDGKQIFESLLDTARYILEAPMPAVNKEQQSFYQILINDDIVDEGVIIRS